MSKGFKKLIERVVTIAKNSICELAKTELSNKVKKERLDNAVIKFITNNAVVYAPTNIFAKFVFNFVINKFILPYIDDLTQLIYNLLKSKINGVTEV